MEVLEQNNTSNLVDDVALSPDQNDDKFKETCVVSTKDNDCGSDSQVCIVNDSKNINKTDINVVVQDFEPNILESKLNQHVLSETYNEHSSNINDNVIDHCNNGEIVESCIVVNDLVNSIENYDKPLPKSNSTEEIQQSKLSNSQLDSASTKILTQSTACLYDTKQDNDIGKSSSYSKSAENILTQMNSDIKQKTEEVDPQKIISEFTNHKNAASATQKIVHDTPPTNENYSRYNKDLLTQDIGSIVKNVHGIFSSVSGSLKNAYNISHRVSQKLPQLPVKSMPNNKILNEIFDEENNTSPEKTNAHDIILNNDSKNCMEGNLDEAEGKEEVLETVNVEKLLEEQRKEMTVLKEKLRQHVEEIQQKDHIYKELESKTELLKKRVENAERDKDSIVMKYASRERTIIESQKAAEAASRAEKAAIAEAELLTAKVRSANNEKQRIIQLYDDKTHELSNVERELAKSREDVKEMEGRVKWLQTKLRCEMDAYKDSAERVEKLQQQVSELETAKESAAINAADSVKARQLETELKQSQADLILCRHEKSDLERRLAHTQQLLDTCKREKEDACEQLERCNIEVLDLREKNITLEQEAAELAALRAQASLADTLSVQLQREKERASQAEQALSRERARADTCAQREAKALEHSATLTAMHVAKAAQEGDSRAHAQALKADNSSLRERIEQLEKERISLDTALSEETDRRSKETRLLARKVAELTEELAESNKRLEWEKGENEVLKKKHSSAIKEVNRELQRALKRIDQLEAKIPRDDTRAGSVSSLSSGEGASGIGDERGQNGHTSSDSVPDVQTKEPDRQALIERIVSLQRANARRAERCEFLEEHCKQLTVECKNKSRVLRQLVCANPPPPNDKHKKRKLTKRDIARLGSGAMSAVWGGDPAGLTPELSLEMIRRLQAVLEDSLLKNITLKESVDTLGKEIERLKTSNNAADSK